MHQVSAMSITIRALSSHVELLLVAISSGKSLMKVIGSLERVKMTSENSVGAKEVRFSSKTFEIA